MSALPSVAPKRMIKDEDIKNKIEKSYVTNTQLEQSLNGTKLHVGMLVSVYYIKTRDPILCR